MIADLGLGIGEMARKGARKKGGKGMGDFRLQIVDCGFRNQVSGFRRE